MSSASWFRERRGGSIEAMTNRIVLPVDRARAVVLVEAIERTDPEGAWLPLPDREDATRRARALLGDSSTADEVAAAIASRADELIATLGRDEPALPRIARGIPTGLLVGAALLIPLIYGLGRSILGPGNTIDIFRNPLILLVLWNSAVTVVSLLVLLFRARGPKRRRDRTDGGDRVPRPPLLSTRLGEWLLALGVGARALRTADRTGHRRRALTEFSLRWRSVAAIPLATTARILLNIGALLLLSTAILEAYLRGLFTEYSASWHTTFLEPAQAERLAKIIYGLPAALLGRAVVLPGAGVGEPAAGWIHLMALAALIYAILPRLFLLTGTIVARHRARRVTVSISPALARRLRARAITGFASVVVSPYSCRIPEGGADRLRALLVELLGERAVIEFASPVEYGAEALDEGRQGGSDPEHLCRVVLFALAQPPETEVHGALAHALAREDAPVIAVVDASGLGRRFGSDDEGRARLAERRRTWDRVLADAGIEACHLDLARDLDDRSFAALGRALAATQDGVVR